MTSILSTLSPMAHSITASTGFPSFVVPDQ
ncbi:hypothetical protein PC116_g31060, partial [Phytophthora cactorum]